MINIKKSFALALAEREITKKELSERCGMTQSYISNVTNGKSNISLRNLVTVIEALDYKVWEFLKLSDS